MSLNVRSRSLYGSPLSQPKFASFVIIMLVVLVVLSAANIINNLFMPAVAKGGISIVLLALAWSAFLSIVPIAVLWFLDRREQESKWLYAIALLWGALIATGVAQPLNGLIINAVKDYFTLHPDVQAIFGENGALLIAAPLAGPIVEETTKGAGVLLLFLLLRSEFDGVRDGFIYGALVGIGFNFLEAPAYILQGFTQTGVAPWVSQLGSRYSVLGVGGHALFTGLFGMGLGLARQTVRPWLRYAAPPVGWLLGFSAHLVNNSIGLILLFIFTITGHSDAPGNTADAGGLEVDSLPLLAGFALHTVRNLITLFPFYLIAVVMLWQSGTWERNVIREELADETEPVITPEEYEAVKHDRPFQTRRIAGTDRRTSAAIVKAQNELAFRKWRVRHLGQSPDKDDLVASWREELRRLRSAVHPAIV